jgi:hypothetical protein
MTTPAAAIHPAARARHGLGDDVRPLLDRRLYALIGTQNDDGTAHLAPVMYLYDNGRIVFETGAATRKARNIAARRHATVLIQTPEAAWVAGAGPAAIVAGDAASHHRDQIRGKYLTPQGRQVCDDLLDEMDDVIIVVHPTHWLSWDLTSFMEALATRGVDPTHADTWFLVDD